MSEMYCRSAPSSISCAQKAPIGPPDSQCPCLTKNHRLVNSILNQSEYEVADDATSLKDLASSKKNNKNNKKNVNISKYEVGDDAVLSPSKNKNVDKQNNKKKTTENANFNQFEIGNDVTGTEINISTDSKTNVNKNNKNLVENANFTEFELADDAISLNGEICDDRPASRNSIQSLKTNENPEFINVNGKEELPSPEYLNKSSNGQISPIKTENTNSNKINIEDKSIINNVQITVDGKRIDNIENSVDGKPISNVEIKINKNNSNFDGNRNRLTVPNTKTYSTLPKRKRESVNHRMWYRPVLEPPHRVTPDGTDIYYWCDMPKRMGQELDDGAYNPLWTMRGFTQTFHFWKENKRAQSVPLNAFLTYITLPWWSIAKDILDHREGPILTF